MKNKKVEGTPQPQESFVLDIAPPSPQHQREVLSIKDKQKQRALEKRSISKQR